MDNFNENQEQVNIEAVNINETVEAPEHIDAENTEEQALETTFNPIKIDDVVPEKEEKTTVKGLKVFAVIMVVVILLSTACVGGYFVGKNTGLYKPNVNVGLDAKPTKTDEMTASQV